MLRARPRRVSTEMPRMFRPLLIVVLWYISAPLRDIPLLGLSLSAPFFFVLVLQMGKTGYLRPVLRQRYWVAPISLFCIGLATSVFGNGILGRAKDVSIPKMLHMLAAFAYWGVLFLVIAFLVGYFRYWAPALRVVGLGSVVLAAAVIAEYALGLQGGPGHGRGVLTLLTQNEIGIQFSAFGLAPLGMALQRRTLRELGWVVGAALVVIAVVLNSSRSSWVALSVGALVIVLFSSVERIRKRAILAGVLGAALVVGTLISAPPQLTEKFRRRAATLQNLDRDKSFQARLALVQKAWKLFSEHPFIGVGPGMFRYRYVDIELPGVLRHSYQKINSISAHNAYMLMLAEGGIVVGLPLVWLLFRLGSQAVRSARKMGSRHPETVVIAAMFISMSLHLWTLAGLGSSGSWLVYGLVASTIWMPGIEPRARGKVLPVAGKQWVVRRLGVSERFYNRCQS